MVAKEFDLNHSHTQVQSRPLQSHLHNPSFWQIDIWIFTEPTPKHMKDDVVEAAHERQRLSVLHKQLIISLKFHHSQTLEQIPLEMAVQAMIEVWQACNPSKTTKP